MQFWKVPGVLKPRMQFKVNPELPSCGCSRYDYEAVESDKANAMVSHLKEIISDPSKADFGPFKLTTADDFVYTDPVDGSVAKNQGIRFVFDDGSRIIFRLSGTGSAGATIRSAAIRRPAWASPEFLFAVHLCPHCQKSPEQFLSHLG